MTDKLRRSAEETYADELAALAKGDKGGLSKGQKNPREIEFHRFRDI